VLVMELSPFKAGGDRMAGVRRFGRAGRDR